MKVLLEGKVYDTDSAKRLAYKATLSSHQELYQTAEGDFFLFLYQIYIDGNKLGPHELWVNLSPLECGASRVSLSRGILPLKTREALEWCIKTQVPETFRGYLLESI